MLGLCLFIWKRKTSSQITTPEYQTSAAEIGTLITTVSGSGSISSGNSTSITTGTSGVVKTVYVSNGDSVQKDQKIAEIGLDEHAQEQRAQAWVDYLDAQESIKTAQKNKASADIAMWQARQDIFDAEDNIEYKNNNSTNPNTKEEYTDSERTIIDKSLHQAQLAFSETELKYKNADSEIQLAQAKVTSAWEDYQELSPSIKAPANGVVSNLALAPEVIIENTSNSTNSTNSDSSSSDTLAISSQKIGQIDNKEGQFQAVINLTEIDIVNVSANQKVSLTLDAFADKSFTGKVLAVDTSGSTNSGVTTYPVTILMDATPVNIYPNMAVTAEIITNITSDVLLVPTSAIQTTNGASTVQVLKEGQPSTVEVDIGESDGTETEIISGISEGDQVITSTTSTGSQTSSERNSNVTSPFSSFGGNGSFGGVSGGGNFRSR